MVKMTKCVEKGIVVRWWRRPSHHLSNPRTSSKLGTTQSSSEQSEDQQQAGVPSDSDFLIHRIGRDNSISCLIRCSRSAYGLIA
ncbi:hypothetical protein PRUPE_2G156000 [Prunus persica]|uniref:Uncharacterized protein n=1 Tax=Prunus persica TaxID=3760 RepID=A0A251QHJ5_PRUPE|nr:hypothetical protein PRUPE_2G156000 [Prunus persica]